MKPTFALFLLLSLFLVINVNDARKLPATVEDYWKSVMKGQPIPGAIKDLFVENPAASLNNEKVHFVKNFDTRSIAVIYRSHDESKKASKEFTEDKRKEEEDKKVFDERTN